MNIYEYFTKEHPYFAPNDEILLDGRNYLVLVVDLHNAVYLLQCLTDPLIYIKYYSLEYVDDFAQKL